MTRKGHQVIAFILFFSHIYLLFIYLYTVCRGGDGHYSASRLETRLPSI